MKKFTYNVVLTENEVNEIVRAIRKAWNYEKDGAEAERLYDLAVLFKKKAKEGLQID